MVTRSRILLGVALLLAVALTWFRIPLASSQGLVLVAAATESDLSALTVDSAVWQEATAVEVPLSAQSISRPILPETTVKAVTARVVHNGQQLAMLVEWSDVTQNDKPMRVQDFRDSVAVQFAHLEGQPFFCMGQQGSNVNIWHWRSDWQAKIAAGSSIAETYPNMHVDYYPFAETSGDIYRAEYNDVNYLPAQAAGNPMAVSDLHTPVEDLIAGGFGSLTSQSAAGQNVQGSGEWVDGKWRALFMRDLASAETEDVSFVTGQVYSVAFAAWDGANGERNGEKSTSQWISLQLGEAAAGAVADSAVPAVLFPPVQRETTSMPPMAIVVSIVLFTLTVIGVIIYNRQKGGV